MTSPVLTERICELTVAPGPGARGQRKVPGSRPGE